MLISAGLGGGHETAHLGHERDEGHLAEVGRLAGHVGPGHQPQLACRFATDIAGVGDESAAVLLERASADLFEKTR